VPDAAGAAGVAGVGDGDAAAAVIIVAPYMTAPTTPPVSIDPAIALPTKILCTRFTVCLLAIGFTQNVSVETQAWGRSLRAPSEEAESFR
jgi:hypothetical protein